MTLCFTNGKIVRRHQIVAEDLWVSNGKIVPPQPNADTFLDMEGRLIAPGYIDLQINGAFGVDFSLGLEQLQTVASGLPRYGVTSFLPTVISTTPEKYRKILPEFRRCTGAEPLGIHLEGPFLNPAQSGAHQKKYFLEFEKGLEECYGSLANVKIVTLAPELKGADKVIAKLKEMGIIVSAGHTQASYDEMNRSGIKLATHLFNAMAPFHHRFPGVIGAALTRSELSYTIIADGIHIDPIALKLAWEANPKGLILISDAMIALGKGKGKYRFGEQEVEVHDDKAVLAGTERIAGSVLTLDTAVRNLCKATGCTVVEAIECASLKPAKLLGLKNKGHLEFGADADFNILSQDLEVKACYVAGVKA